MERDLSESEAYEKAAKELYKADGGRIGLKFGSEPQDAEVGIMTIDVEAGDDEDEENMKTAYFPGDVFSKAEITRLFSDKSLTTNTDRKQLFKILMNPGQFPEAEEMLIKLLRGKKDGGRIMFADGTPDKELEKILATSSIISDNPNDPRNMTTDQIIAIIQTGRSTPEMFEELMLRGYTGVDSLMVDEIGGKTLDKPQQVYSFNPAGERGGIMENFLFDLRENNPESYGEYNRPQKFEGKAYMEPVFKANGGRIKYAKGANRVSELLILRDEKNW